MHTSLIMLQVAELNTVLPQIDDLAKKHNLSRADIIRNAVYQHFGYQVPERPSKQKDQEHNKEISLQLTLHNKYVLVFLDVDFQNKYLGTSYFMRMVTAINIINRSFNQLSQFNSISSKQSKYVLNPQISANCEEVFNEKSGRSWNCIYGQDLKLFNIFYFIKMIKRRNGTMTRRNGVISTKREDTIKIGLEDGINGQNAITSTSI